MMVAALRKSKEGASDGLDSIIAFPRNYFRRCLDPSGTHPSPTFETDALGAPGLDGFEGATRKPSIMNLEKWEKSIEQCSTSSFTRSRVDG